MSVLFLGKRDNPYAADAAVLVSQLFPDTTVVFTASGERPPEELRDWSGDWIFSYLCQWVVPQWLLDKAGKGALNFHPGPPQYPGIGCTNFAIYNGETEFGVTCHHMAARVDTGNVVAVSRFPLFPEDSVLSLTKRCYAHIAWLFNDIVCRIHAGEPLPQSDEHWTRKPYTRKELHEMCRLEFDMDETEIKRRVRATTFPNMPGPYFEVMGRRYIQEGSRPVPD
ncbi:formyltransferase family protein [Pseudodesulfovibrio sp.]|uniref:formyltransferase family protein n=1 Tax=unclassified Pseudodesulfovibrio TaxID=2661612 RepID=UPI003B00713C